MQKLSDVDASIAQYFEDRDSELNERINEMLYNAAIQIDDDLKDFISAELNQATRSAVVAKFVQLAIK